MQKAKSAPTNIGKVKVKIKNTPAVHIHTPKQVVVKAKLSGKDNGKDVKRKD